MRFKIISLIVFLVLLIEVVQAQKVLDVINKAEKSVLTVSTYKKGVFVGRSSGFMISEDGLVLTSGVNFFNIDSALITTQNKKSYGVAKVISVHRPTNLVLLKVSTNRKPSFNYLLPSKIPFSGAEELLVFGDLNNSKESIQLGKISNIDYLPFVNRVGVIGTSLTAESNGGAIVNSLGEVAGIAVNVGLSAKTVVYDIRIMNDSNWTTIDEKPTNLMNVSNKERYLRSDFATGIYHLVNGQYSSAVLKFSDDLRNIPDNYVVYIMRGWAKIKNQKFDEAMLDLDYSKRLNARPFLTYYLYAQIQLHQSNQKKAERYLDSCLVINESYGPAWTDLGIIEQKRPGREQNAFNYFTNSVKSNPLYANAFFERARLRTKFVNQSDKALADITEAIRLNPYLTGIYTIRGLMKFTAQDYMSAMTDFDSAIRINNEDYYAYFNRGLTHYNLGMKNKARNDWNRAGELGYIKAYKYINNYCK